MFVADLLHSVQVHIVNSVQGISGKAFTDYGHSSPVSDPAEPLPAKIQVRVAQRHAKKAAL